MADEKQMKQAKSTFEAFCKMLDKKELHYSRDDEKMKITFSMATDDLDLRVSTVIDPDSMIINLYSPLPFTVGGDSIVDMAMATSFLNFYVIKDGSFDFDCMEGNVGFRLTSSFRDSIISESLLEYVLFVSLNTVDSFNDSLYRLAKKEISLKEFISEPHDEKRD